MRYSKTFNACSIKTELKQVRLIPFNSCTRHKWAPTGFEHSTYNIPATVGARKLKFIYKLCNLHILSENAQACMSTYDIPYVYATILTCPIPHANNSQRTNLPQLGRERTPLQHLSNKHTNIYHFTWNTRNVPSEICQKLLELRWQGRDELQIGTSATKWSSKKCWGNKNKALSRTVAFKCCRAHLLVE